MCVYVCIYVCMYLVIYLLLVEFSKTFFGIRGKATFCRQGYSISSYLSSYYGKV